MRLIILLVLVGSLTNVFAADVQRKVRELEGSVSDLESELWRIKDQQLRERLRPPALESLPKLEPIYVPGETLEDRADRHAFVRAQVAVQHRADWERKNPFAFSPTYKSPPERIFTDAIRASDAQAAANAQPRRSHPPVSLARIPKKQEPQSLQTAKPKQPPPPQAAPPPTNSTSIAYRRLSDGRVMVIAGPFQRTFANEADAMEYIEGYKRGPGR